MLELKNIYRSKEIKFYDFLMSHQQGLRDDFLRNNPTWISVQNAVEYEIEDSNIAAKYNVSIQEIISKKNGWNRLGFISQFDNKVRDHQREKYPTAFKIIDHFSRLDCTAAAYSTFEPGNILSRHTGPENRTAKNIRIHIPLIIPEGDVGFEVHGEEIRWDDIFAFNNQKAHSAWNLTNERRLIFILDVTRSICDMPPAPEWFPGCNDNAPEFYKTQKEGEIWKKSIAQQR
jgi:hypothetical protein